MMKYLSVGRAEAQTIMIDATYLNVHRTASGLGGKKGDRATIIGWTKGGMNTKLHAITNWNAHLLSFFMTAGQISDYTGVTALLDSFPKAQWMLADRSYDADWFRKALEEKGIKPCVPDRKSRGKPIRYDRRRYKRCNRIEIMFGRLKDWRSVATCYVRCPTVFLLGRVVS